MNPYLTHKEIREFEDRIGYKTILEANRDIAIALNFKPEISYAVGDEKGFIYTPNDSYFRDEHSQELEAKRWLHEQTTKYPDGFVAKDGYKVIKIETYPSFHTDWNHLIEALKRIDIQCIAILVEWDIFEVWTTLIKYVNLIK